jgi:hypothetical protein
MHDIETSNALHAAEAWLQRIGAADDDVVVVSVAPRASLGRWRHGAAEPVLEDIADDAGAELAEAAATVVGLALEEMQIGGPEAVAAAVLNGAHLRALLLPASGMIAFHLVRGANTVVLGIARAQVSAPANKANVH